MNWITCTIASTCFFGLWALFSKLAANYISYTSIFIYECLIFFIGGLVVFAVSGWRAEWNFFGVIFSLLYGISGLIATYFFVAAISKGPVSIVTIITATYPCVTIVLAFYFLNEQITFKQLAGVFFIMVGIFLLLGDKNTTKLVDQYCHPYSKLWRFVHKAAESLPDIINKGDIKYGLINSVCGTDDSSSAANKEHPAVTNYNIVYDQYLLQRYFSYTPETEKYISYLTFNPGIQVYIDSEIDDNDGYGMP